MYCSTICPAVLTLSERINALFSCRLGDLIHTLLFQLLDFGVPFLPNFRQSIFFIPVSKPNPNTHAPTIGFALNEIYDVFSE